MTLGNPLPRVSRGWQKWEIVPRQRLPHRATRWPPECTHRLGPACPGPLVRSSPPVLSLMFSARLSGSLRSSPCAAVLPTSPHSLPWDTGHARRRSSRDLHFILHTTFTLHDVNGDFSYFTQYLPLHKVFHVIHNIHTRDGFSHHVRSPIGHVSLSFHKHFISYMIFISYDFSYHV